MGQLLVRNLDDKVISTLKKRARDSGTSLEAVARQILTASAAPDRAELIRWLREFRARQKPSKGPDSLTLLRQTRDEGWVQRGKKAG